MFKFWPCLLLVALVGCQAGDCAGDAESVAAAVQQRMGTGSATPEKIQPENFTTLHPLTEDHAVLLALWNNAAFQEALVSLKITRGDLIQAGLLPNPEVVYFFGVTDKPFKYAIDLPLEALWLRPIRIQAAAAENARACEVLTQTALDLIRDTRQAYADLVLARERVRIADEAVRLRERISALAEARFKAGDTSKQDTAIAKIDALQARQDATRIGVEVPVAEERLKLLLGLPALPSPVATALPATTPEPTRPPLEVESLAQEASTTRPDYQAVATSVEAARERLRLSRTSWFRFLLLADASSGRDTGHELGPAFRTTLPIFNWNQGNIARAVAETEQLERRLTTIHNQIIADVRQAAARYQQNDKELTALHLALLPEVEAGIKRSEKAYEAGNATYLIVLEATRQLIDTYNREATLKAERQRAWAELERSVGKRLPASSTALAP